MHILLFIITLSVGCYAPPPLVSDAGSLPDDSGHPDASGEVSDAIATDLGIPEWYRSSRFTWDPPPPPPPPPFCGDGNVDPGEECDSGAETFDCDPDCTIAECWDDYVNIQAGEECEPMVDADCSHLCTSFPSTEFCGTTICDTLPPGTNNGEHRCLGYDGHICRWLWGEWILWATCPNGDVTCPVGGDPQCNQSNCTGLGDTCTVNEEWLDCRSEYGVDFYRCPVPCPAGSNCDPFICTFL